LPVQAPQVRPQELAAAVAVLLVAGAAVCAWLALRASRAEAQAVENEGRARDAAKDAAEQRRRAGAAAAESRAVLAFFQDKVLAVERPRGPAGHLGKDVTVRQAVDAAEKDLAAAFADQPLAEASI